VLFMFLLTSVVRFADIVSFWINLPPLDFMLFFSCLDLFFVFVMKSFPLVSAFPPPPFVGLGGFPFFSVVHSGMWPFLFFSPPSPCVIPFTPTRLLVHVLYLTFGPAVFSFQCTDFHLGDTPLKRVRFPPRAVMCPVLFF